MTKKGKIYYARLDELWTKEQKYEFLEKTDNIYNIDWQLINPNSKNIWLTDDLEEDFDSFIALGDKQSKSGKFNDAKTIFHQYSGGVLTARDAWVYNINPKHLTTNVSKMIETYNYELVRYQNNKNNITNIDDFVTNDSSKISWSSTLKKFLKAGKLLEFLENNIRKSLYRPFVTSYLYFSDSFNDRIGKFDLIFPTPETEQENLVICCNSVGNTTDFHCLAVNIISDIHLTGDTQCFPFYIYDEDGSNKRENITDYSLQEFRQFYQDQTISKWDIFYYVYAILHHPEYRRKYAANLKRELPRIPPIPLSKGSLRGDQNPLNKGGLRGDQNSFKEISQIGEKLANIHVNYEQQSEYKLKLIENPDFSPSLVRGVGGLLRVEKMKLSKDKTEIIYNDYLTLKGIPPEVWQYKLGNKSALDWIIDQYQIKTDKRSGINNDPNRLEDEMYIVKLIQKIVTVSVETVKLVSELREYSLS